MSVIERKDFESIAESTFKDAAQRGDKHARGFSIRMTSGTSTGGPITICWESAYTAQSVSKGANRFLLYHGLRTLRLGIVLQQRNIGIDGVRTLVLDPADVTPEVCRLLGDFMPDRVYSFPTLITQLAPQLQTSVREGIEMLAFSGECLTQAYQDFFAKWFSNAQVRLVYIANEIGSISDDGCGFLPRNHYHPKATVKLEIKDIDTEGVGDLHISTKITEHTLVENYRNGDVGRWSGKECICGNKKIFEVLGRRGYDFIKIGSAILRQEECDRVAVVCQNLFDDYRIEVSQEVKGDAIVGRVLLRVYRARGGFTEADREAIMHRVSNGLFLSYSKTFTDFVAARLLAPLEVELSSEPFVKGHKNIKLKQLAQ